MTLILASRAQRPYPPGRVMLNGDWPSQADDPIIGLDLVLNWRHRGKVALGETVVAYDDNSNYGPDTGTTYTLKVFNNTSGSLLYSATGITGTTATVSFATFTTNAVLRIELTAVKDSLSSLFPVVALVNYESGTRYLLTSTSKKLTTPSGNRLRHL